MNCFFVGGSQRSGTNLLNTILCQDPATNPMIHEAHYITRLMLLYRWAKLNFDDNTCHFFDGEAALRAFHRDALTRLLEGLNAQHGSAALVLKDPHMTMYFPDMDALLDDSRFLCMVRNPWDTVASMVRVGQRLAAQGVAQFAFFAERDIPRICEHYKSFYAPLLQCSDAGFRSRVLLLRYEDLVAQPATALQQLRKFTGLPLAGLDPHGDFDTGNIDYAAAPPVWQAWITEHYGKRVSGERVRSYTEVLSAHEVETISTNCADVIKLFDYRI